MADNTALLADAKAKFHQLVTGSLARVFVDQNGERVEFTAANRQDLYDYIQQLTSEVECPAPRQSRKGPMRFVF
jgi:hypothetical protein